MPDFLKFKTVNVIVNYFLRGVLMIFDTMTYSVMVVVAAMSFVVILLARTYHGEQDNSN